MEKLMSYSFIIPLKEVSLRRIAINLWCRPAILAQIDADDLTSDIEIDLDELKLPTSLREEVKCLIRPIFYEILHFKEFHEKYLEIGKINMFYILQQLCWTVLGTVDYRKTAEIVVHSEMLDIFKLYRLACLYCLDEYIPTLWANLPEEWKKYYYEEEGQVEVIVPELEFYWPYILKGEEARLDVTPISPFGEPISFNQYAFQYSAYKGNKVASEYFFRKLPCDVREGSLLSITEKVSIRRMDECDKYYDENIDNFPEENISDVFRYLFSLMKPEEKMEFLKDYPGEVLACILDWPWQDLFLDIVELIWNYLDADDYVRVLLRICEKVVTGRCLRKLFHEFFLRGSSDFIRNFVQEDSYPVNILRYFFTVHDSETIEIIFRKLDSIDRKAIISSEHVYKLFFVSIWGDSMFGDCRYLVELCLEEATLSREDIKELRETYARFLPDFNSKEDTNRREFLCGLLDNLDENISKNDYMCIDLDESDEEDMS